MVVVAGQVLRELEACELVVRHEPVHDTGLLEHDEVAVHRALREPVRALEDLCDRQGVARLRQDVEQPGARRRETLVLLLEPARGRLADVGRRDRARAVPGSRVGGHGGAVYRPVRSRLMGPAARFAALVDGENTDVRLDVGALCIAAHARLDVVSGSGGFAAWLDRWLAKLDELAARCATPTFEGVRALLFDLDGYRGDTERYGDPENSFLDAVIARRRGIPITLSILVIEVARRLDVDVVPVGMPGHFLVRPADDARVYCDPFHRGALLDAHGCRELFDGVFGGTRVFDPTVDLRVTPPRLVLARVLANLEQGPLARDPAQLKWMCELHLSIPDVALAERIALARRLERVTDPSSAADVYDLLARDADDPIAERLLAESRRLRARMN